MKQLSEIKVGDTFAGADGVERILLDFLPDGTALTLTRDFVFMDERFDENSNNYARSNSRNRLETEKLPELEKTFGKENVVEFDVDLTSDDGLDTYGKVKVKYGLLTAEEYRKYNRIISRYAVDDWWWLATANSTPERNINYWVRCVAAGGDICDFNSFYRLGVRAVCELKTNILVKEIKNDKGI